MTCGPRDKWAHLGEVWFPSAGLTELGLQKLTRTCVLVTERPGFMSQLRCFLDMELWVRTYLTRFLICKVDIIMAIIIVGLLW